MVAKNTQEIQSHELVIADLLQGRSLASYIDHTLLKETASQQEILKVCAEARQFQFATVCIRPQWVILAAQELAQTTVKPITVVGFPSGQETTQQKVKETLAAIQDGAREIDMVLNRQWIRNKDYRNAEIDISEVVRAAGSIPVKVILETCELTDSEKMIACSLSKAAGAAYVKTSTGFAASGATVQDIFLMREIVGTDMGVKASGGVRTTQDALKMILAGASRIGASSSVAIVSGTDQPVSKSAPGTSY